MATPARRQSRTRPCRVLLAEDDLEMRRLLAWSLEHAGHEVVECADGITLLRKLSRPGWMQAADPIDVVVSDIRMPGYTGLEVLASMREFEDCPPIILISAFADAAAREQARELGAAALLPKPFDQDELVEAVERLLPAGVTQRRAPAAREPESGPGFPLEVEFRHGPVRAPVEEFVRDLAAKLEHRSDDIQRCRVVVDALLRPEERHRWYAVKVILVTRDAGTVVVERESSPGHGEESLYAGLQMAFAALHRRLEKTRARRRAHASRQDRDELLEAWQD